MLVYIQNTTVQLTGKECNWILYKLLKLKLQDIREKWNMCIEIQRKILTELHKRYKYIKQKWHWYKICVLN